MTELKEKILDKYIQWIRDKTFLKDLKEGVVKIRSPFLDAHNDNIILYAKQGDKGNLKLTDDGYLVLDLTSYGIKLTSKREELFKMTISSYGVKYNPETYEIYVDSNLETIGRDKHKLIQCLIKLNDLFNYTEQNIKELFFYDVYNTFVESGIAFIENFELRGSSGYGHRFDFGIPKRKESNEQLVRLVSNPKQKINVEAYLYSFIDVQKTGRKFDGIIIYKGRPTNTFTQAIEKWNYQSYSWDDQKAEVLKILNKSVFK